MCGSFASLRMGSTEEEAVVVDPSLPSLMRGLPATARIVTKIMTLMPFFICWGEESPQATAESKCGADSQAGPTTQLWQETFSDHLDYLLDAMSPTKTMK